MGQFSLMHILMVLGVVLVFFGLRRLSIKTPHLLSLAVSLILIFLVDNGVFAQEVKTFKVDSQKSQVTFTAKAKYLKGAGGYTVNGKFDDVQGQIQYDSNNILQSKVQMEVGTASVHTDNSMRDNHLREEEFFDSKNSPRASFRSLNLQQTSATEFLLKGKLIIRGTPKVVTFNLKPVGQYKENGKNRVIFEAHTTLDRTDFGVGATPSGFFSGLMSAMISIENTVELNVKLDAYEESSK